jgi:lycopene cyclase domain-containing protein
MALSPGYWYFWMDMGLWAIAFFCLGWAWPRLILRTRLIAAATAGWVMLLQVVNELLSLRIFHAWSFSLEHNRFIGIEWLGAPLEEYLFWFAFSWMIPFLYSGFRQNQKTVAEPGRLAAQPEKCASTKPEFDVKLKAPEDNSPGVTQAKKLYLIWWVLGTLAVIAGLLPFFRKKIDWSALLKTSAIFIVIMTAAESAGLYWKWWIWNPAQLLGPKVGLIPLEEFSLYFLVVPLLVVFQTGFEWMGEKIFEE